MNSNEAWPFIVIRHGSVCHELTSRMLDIAAAHPGSCDEIWLCYAYGVSAQRTREEAAQLAVPVREKCGKLGIRCSFQQIMTIGHVMFDSKWHPTPGDGRDDFGDGCWQIDKDGNLLRGIFCPRSPDVLRRTYECARAVMEVQKPDSYWIDDDLRLGIRKPDGCFCPRCLAAFNARHGTSFTRESLAARLYGEAILDSVRRDWIDFNADAIADLAAEVRRAADDVLPECRLGVQTVWADEIYTGRDYFKVLAALSGSDHRAVGIRPGACFYEEDRPRDMLYKALSVAREAERCRDYGFIGQVCYEEENFMRQAVNKSRGAIYLESALALASGCDSVSLYWYDPSTCEPLELYDEFAEGLSKWRPYYEHLAASVRRTRLAGVAWFPGSDNDCGRSFLRNDPTEMLLAAQSIPLTVAESGTRTWWITRKSIEEATADDLRKILSNGAIVEESTFGMLVERLEKEGLFDCLLPDAESAKQAFAEAMREGAIATLGDDGAIIGKQLYPTVCDIPRSGIRAGAVVLPTPNGGRLAIVPRLERNLRIPERTAVLDALDGVTPDGMPVRVECGGHPFRVLARVDGDGRIDSVTILNLSIGESSPIKVKIRRQMAHPDAAPRLERPTQAAIQVQPSCINGEKQFTLPPLPGWQIATLFL